MARVVLPAASSLEAYPERWQDACRSALRLYCELPQNRRGGKPMGMTRLRNIIMAEFDTWDGQGKIKDGSLGREDLEHWMKKNRTYLSVTKFQYIDYWIRENRNNSPLSEVLDGLITYKEDSYRKAFSELYTVRHRESSRDIDHHLRELSGTIFYSDVIKIPKTADDIRSRHDMKIGGHRQIAIIFRDHSHYSISATVIYLDTPISEIRPNPSKRDWVVCFGYLTIEMKNNAQFETISGPFHVFRDRTRGTYMSGTSISRCTIQLHDYELQTGWHPQLASQTSFNGYKSDLENPELIPIDGDNDYSNIGIRKFYRTNSIDDKLLEYGKNLKNRYLVW